MTDNDIQSIRDKASRFENIRKAAKNHPHDGKLASAFLIESLTTTLPLETLKLCDTVLRLNSEKDILIEQLAEISRTQRKLTKH